MDSETPKVYTKKDFLSPDKLAKLTGTPKDLVIEAMQKLMRARAKVRVGSNGRFREENAIVVTGRTKRGPREDMRVYPQAKDLIIAEINKMKTDGK